MRDDGTPNATIHDLTPVQGTPLAERRHDPAESLQAVLDAREAERRALLIARMKVWGPVVLALLGGGTYAGVEYLPAPGGEIHEELQRTKEQGEQNTRQIRALGKVTVEGLNHLGKKIDAINPEAKDVPKPPSLVAAEKQVEDQDTEDAVTKMLETGGAGDGR